MEALAHRTAARVEEIGVGASQRGGERNSPFRFDGGDREDVFGDGREQGHPSPPTYQRAIGISSEPRTDGLSRAVGGSKGRFEDESLCVPESAVRKNITQRRSRGKTKDEGNIAPDASMISRRPRSRSKDRRYSIESVGIWRLQNNRSRSGKIGGRQQQWSMTHDFWVRPLIIGCFSAHRKWISGVFLWYRAAFASFV
jgi:hypothetical protein